VPEDGEISAEENRRVSRKRSRSDSTSTQSSSTRVKPRQYRDDSSDSSVGSRRKGQKSQKRQKSQERVKRSKSSSPSHQSGSRSRNGGRRASRGDDHEDSIFGQTYIPPAGFCRECDERYGKGDSAMDHFQSKRHLNNTRNRYRCYFCPEYVQDTKQHLESRHRDMTFQCLLNGCARPRFTQVLKVIDHVRCNHPHEFRRSRNDMDLFVQRMISMPKNIMSFTCRECKIMFHGDVKIAIVHLVLEHGISVPKRSDFGFSCRVCPKRGNFDNEKELELHCQEHLEEAKNRQQPRRRRSKSRSRSPTPLASTSLAAAQESSFFRYGKSTLICHFCPDQFRSLASRKAHMLDAHEELLFQCELCTFHNMYRRDLIWHLREHHRKDRFGEEELVRNYISWPKDLRKVFCGKCTESEAHDTAVWMAVDPHEVSWNFLSILMLLATLESL
jgi:hypothetical protein